MAQVGVFPSAVEVPASTNTLFNTANLFAVGLADWGPVGVPTACSSLANAASTFGTPSGSGNPYASRTSTSAAILDAVDAFCHEDGNANPTIYISRVVGPTPVNASLIVKDGTAETALTVTALYPGIGGNGINLAVANDTDTFTVTLYDGAGNTLAASPTLSSNAAAVTWAATTAYITAVAGDGELPATLAATALAGGTDDRTDATIADWQTALAAFSPNLGPGQVICPGQTNTTLSGIWSALGTHAEDNNRVAILNTDDDEAASTIVSDVSSFNSSSVASYCGFWAGNRNIAGVTAGTIRSVSPDSVIAALCARADQTGNQNIAAAGSGYPLTYATSPTSLVSGTYDTYSLNDLYTLNGAGVNTFQDIYGSSQNYGFVGAILPTSDPVYWQFNHARMRMALVSQAQIIGQPFVFAQLDAQGATATAFGSALTAMLKAYATAGALWAYTVDVGPTVNTTDTIAAAQLNAVIGVQFANFAQMVSILIQVTPLSQSVS